MENQFTRFDRLFRFSPTSLFYTLLACSYFIPNMNIPLFPHIENQIGEASLHGIDIASRVSGIYTYLFIFVICWITANFIFSFPVFKPNDIQYGFNSTISRAGCVQVIAGYFIPSLIPIAGLFAAVHVGIFICGKLPNKSAHTLSAPLAAAITLMIWLNIIWIIGFVLPAWQHFVFWTICFTFFLAWIELRLSLQLDSVLNWTLILAFSVLSPFIVTEIHYFIYVNSGFYIAPILLYVLYLTILFLCAFLLQKKNKLRRYRPLVFKHIWLIIACGLCLQSFYHPYGTATSELFELANRAIPLMEAHFFNVYPLIHKASSHFISDYGYGIFYEFLYGYQGLDFLVFDIFEPLIWVIISFQLVYSITRKTLFAFYFAALFPFADAALSPYYSLALIPLLILISEWKSPNSRNAWYFGIITVMLIPWRADLAFALIFCLIAVLGISIWLKKITWRFLLPTFYFSIVLGAFLLIFCSILNVDWQHNLTSTLDYLSSSQSYGLSNLGDISSVDFIWQHFLLPLLIIGCILFSIKELLSKSKQSRNHISWLIVLFLSIFYLINLPRGIVRHGFAEGYDNFLSSFAFFIIPLTIALILPFRESGRWMTWLAMLFFVMTFLRFPNRKPESGLLLAGMNSPVQMNNIPTKLDARLKTDKVNISPDVFALAEFLKTNLHGNETFIDFGNTPMLYFYAEKQVPSFFYQSPQNVHSITLQKDWIKRLKDYNVPLLLFRHSPKNWWDATDDVANELRHYIMAEYFYKMYTPWKRIHGYEIWRKNTTANILPDSLSKTFEDRNWERINVDKHPAFWRPLSNSKKVLKIITDQVYPNFRYCKIPDNSIKKPALFEFTFINKAKLLKHVELYFVKDSNDFGGLDFSILPNQEAHYVVRPSMMWSWWKVDLNYIRLQLGDSVSIKSAEYSIPTD